MRSPGGNPPVIEHLHAGIVRTNVPTAVRALRRARQWRQTDLGDRSGLTRDFVSRVERGELAGLTVGTLGRLAEALEAVLVLELRWQGADLDRLVDRAHAALQETVAVRLRLAGWTTHLEVSFNHYGDRGRCDVVAWHPAARTLLIVEVKSRLGNLQDTLGSLDVKRRVAGVVAEQLGCPKPATVVTALVVADQRTARRIVASHPSMFGALPLRGSAALTWISAPTGAPSGLLWFQRLPDSGGSRVTSIERVRIRRSDG